MIVDKGPDFPVDIERTLLGYGPEMWTFRYQPDHRTTRALNSFRGEHRRWEIYQLVSIDWESVRKFRVQNSSNTFNASRSWGNQVGKAKDVTFRMFTITSAVYYIGVHRNLGTYNNLWANPCSLTILVMLKSFWSILPFKDLLRARRTWWADLCPEVDIDLQVC